MKKLAIITTHPIQYNAPLFQLMAKRKRIDLRVFYTWGEKVLKEKFDPGFRRKIEWDIPLLEGYAYEFVENVSPNPGSSTYNGIDNPDLVKILERWAPDSILVYGWNFKSHLRVLRYFSNKKNVFFRGDSTLLDSETRFIKKTFKRIILRWVFSKLEKAFYTGSNNRDYFLYYGLKERQLVFAPHAIDNERFEKESNSGEVNQIRGRVGIKEQDVVFLFCGKFENKKDPLLLAAAFNKIEKDDCRLLFVGNGDLEISLKQYCAHNKRIHFMDFQNQSQMPSLYAAADIFVLPSKGPGETWGLSINEAMACGKAVLASYMCGGAVDLINPGENGYIFKSGDVIDLQEKMLLLYEQKDNLIKMGSISRSIIKNFSFDKIAEAIESACIMP